MRLLLGLVAVLAVACGSPYTQLEQREILREVAFEAAATVAPGAEYVERMGGAACNLGGQVNQDGTILEVELAGGVESLEDLEERIADLWRDAGYEDLEGEGNVGFLVHDVGTVRASTFSGPRGDLLTIQTSTLTCSDDMQLRPGESGTLPEK